MYYLNLFFVYSILGFLFESTVVRLLSSDYQSGFVYGFWTPVYGIGVVIIILIYKFLSRYINISTYLAIYNNTSYYSHCQYIKYSNFNLTLYV